MTRWIDAGAADALAVGDARLVRDDTHRIALFRVADGGVFAVDDACPHEGYPLHQGEVQGCTLTCRWHTFRFDLRDGVCLVGDEAVRSYPVRERDGRVEIDVTDPDPAAVIAARRAALADAVVAGRHGQAAREVARLLALGVSGRDVLVELVRVDARHGEYGVGHTLPLAADIAPLLPGGATRAELERAVLLVQQVVDNAIRSVQRSPARQVPAALPAGEQGAFLAAVDAEDAPRAEALARAAVRAGVDVHPWLVRACAAHFLGFGHGLIYTVKARELGVLGDEDVVGALVFRLCAQNRDDLLPAWAGWRRWAAALDGDGLWTVARRRGDLRDLDPVAHGTAQEAHDAVAAALSAGRLPDVLDAVAVAASERLLRFQLAHDDDPAVQEGWLDVTHTLTFADAVREAVRDVDHPDVLRLVLQAVRFVNHARVLDGDATGVDDPGPGGALGAAMERALGDVDPDPIVVAHVVKTAVAAERLARTLPPEVAGLPRRAAARFVASPIQQRWTRLRVHDAARLVFDGLVPRTLT